MSFFELWLNGFMVCMCFLTVLWIISVILTNASIIDPFWGSGFIVLSWYYAYATGNFSTKSLLILALVAIWGLRLSIFLFFRNMGHGEDYRYQQFRKDYGPERYWWVSFFQVFLLQGVLMSIVALPLLGIIQSNNEAITSIDILILILWLVGFSFEAGGDHQLMKFKSDPSNRGKVLNTGFWRYTRHPNYFGDALVWWSFGLYAVFSESYYTIIGSVLMTFLLMKVSGVTLLEKSLKTSKPEYAEYIQRTNSFFPWFPKNN